MYYRKYIKRIIDIVLAFLGLVVLSPVLLLISISILLCMGIPILFSQNRPGLNEKPFQLLKFRTMDAIKGADDEAQPQTTRVTKLGKMLRNSSLDELPELLNILKGDMSFVGPRPLLMKYLPFYSSEEKRRHSVKPGLTGLAQINGRNSIPWDEKFKYDLWYVDHISIRLDIKILLITVSKIIKSEGINFSQTDVFKSFDKYPISKADSKLSPKDTL